MITYTQVKDYIIGGNNMEIRKEINDFYALADMVWSGAVDTIKDIQNANKEDEFMNFLEGVFCDEVPTDTEVNDFIWFERDAIYESIGLTENGKLPEEEMIEALNESIKKLELEDDFDEFCGDCDCENVFVTKFVVHWLIVKHSLRIIKIKLLPLMTLKRLGKKKLE